MCAADDLLFGQSPPSQTKTHTYTGIRRKCKGIRVGILLVATRARSDSKRPYELSYAVRASLLLASSVLAISKSFRGLI